MKLDKQGLVEFNIKEFSDGNSKQDQVAKISRTTASAGSKVPDQSHIYPSADSRGSFSSRFDCPSFFRRFSSLFTATVSLIRFG